MTPKGRKPGRKTKLTVQFKPIEGNGFFDIKPPKGEEWRAPEPETKKQGRLKGFFSFFGLAFAIFLILFVLGIAMSGWGLFEQAKPLAFAGYDSLKEGVGDLKGQDLVGAKIRFAKAEQSFEALSENLRYLTGQANQYLDSPLYLDAANKLIQVGVMGSQIGQGLTDILEGAKQIPSVFVDQNLKGGTSVKLTDVLRGLQLKVEDLNQKTLTLKQDLETLGATALPTDVKAEIAKAQEPVALFLEGLAEVRGNFGTALKLLGDKVIHRYLVLLQNNHELRATGGFIGSYLLIDVGDGAIQKMEAKDVYETDGNLIDFVPPPPGIDKVADRLYMRDANYSPDFPTSAKQIMWFLEHSKGPSVDTVVAIDQSVAEKLLELTGPIDSKAFPMPVTAQNFNDLFSFNIESKQSETSTPKQMLIDFIPLVKEKLLGLNDFSKLLDVAAGLAQSRDIQVYSEDPDVEALATRFGLDGRMVAADPKTDFLALVTTAIGGNKSDAFIKTQVDHHTEVDRLGKVTDRLTITKADTWTENDFATWQTLVDRYGTGKADLKTLKFIQGQGDNMDYLRVYVPKGSHLIGLEGMDLAKLAAPEDLGYSVFAFPFGPLSPGQSKSVTITYELPFMIKSQPGDIYKFISQKQAGSENVTLNKSLAVSDALKIVETYPKVENGAFTLYPEFSAPLDSNQIFLSAIASAY
jgi:hypothetical protein